MRTATRIREEINALKRELDKVLNKRTAVIKRVQLSGLMELAKRGVVTFIKINGDIRVMEFEPRHIWDPKDLHTKYLTVYDLRVNDFRKVNLETVIEVEVENVIYKVR
ncbi:MAG: hypothetical protein ACXABY_13125 [Candidatus Thorarchaeota archaeon]|jgi:hypothetical protein